MNTQIHKTLSFEYEKKRYKALMEAERKKEEIMKLYPELQDVDERIKRAGLELARLALYSEEGQGKTEELKDEIEKLRKKKEYILASHDITPEFLEPVFECEKCMDTGFDGEDGTQRCSCYRQKLLNTAYKQFNLELAEKENFQIFNPEIYSNERDEERYRTKITPRENIMKIKERCMQFIEDFDNPEDKNLMFTGEVGLGKTFLSNCITKELLQKGKTVIYQTAPRLLDMVLDFKMRYDRDDYFDTEQYNALFEVDLLIIDDLGAEALNSTRFSELFTIINTRLLTQHSKCTKTILSTNLSLENMEDEKYGDRFMSRILGNFYICKFFGEDIRIKKAR